MAAPRLKRSSWIVLGPRSSQSTLLMHEPTGHISDSKKFEPKDGYER